MGEVVTQGVRVRRGPEEVWLVLQQGDREWTYNITSTALRKQAELREAVRLAKEKRESSQVELAAGLVASVTPRWVSYRVHEGKEVHVCTARHSLDKTLELVADRMEPLGR
jgi:hypothetical protein